MGGQQKTAQRFVGPRVAAVWETVKIQCVDCQKIFENDLNPKSTGPTSMVSGSLCCNNRGGVRFLLLVYRDCENVFDGNP